ncbi:TonB-dependent receptor [Algoriphagus limi]|uniref:TonB-dependent receptor n=1 Tax=Algoriphagus limi TaxID=2975273 RepID=A0ABT2G9C9_9BACT|nr:TonB-dependent receptor [Algoriphagus limi]MCS5491882.1 TonB-dependent receptor [Algoriphagus limi]
MILFVWVVLLFGQEVEKSDTLRLQEIQIEAPVYQEYGRGKKRISWNKEELKNYTNRSIAELLAEKSPVFIRQYGPGMLASSNFRGTSAGHTAIFWNGIPLNSPSLGQSDLSILPMIAVDQVDLSFGSDGALLGNESLSGSIHLSSESLFNQSPTLLFQQEFGSFGQYHVGLKGGYSTEKLGIQTKVYYQNNPNEYNYRDFSEAGSPIKKQDHAAFQQKGFLQDFQWKINSNQQLKASYWWNEAIREIQPVMGSSTHDIQTDESHRFSLQYLQYGRKGIFEVQSGWVKDRQYFNQIKNETSSLFLNTDWTFNQTGNWEIRLGSRGSLISGDLSTYSAQEVRWETYQFINFSGLKNLDFSLNLRQLFYEDQVVPFIPSLGMDWRISNEFSLKTSFGKGFKIPTLNDRYWEPGGNPSLLPEESWQGEMGVLWQKRNFESQLTHYRLKVNNWILWQPEGSIWIPENLRQVRNQGLEWDNKLETKIGKNNLTFNWGYTYTNAVNLPNPEESSSFWNKQLPYTPQHQARGSMTFSRAKFSFQFSSQYVGPRATTLDNSRIMEGYFLAQTHLSVENFNLGPFKTNIQFRIQNLLNKEYQVLYLRPMPGRSYHINLSIQL